MAGNTGKIEIIQEHGQGAILIVKGGAARRLYRFNVRAGNGKILLSGIRWLPERAKARRVAENIIWLFRRRKIKIVFEK
jgi:hypothetical protein